MTSFYSCSALAGMSLEEAKSHWAFQPLSRPQPPVVQSRQFVQNPIDAFLLEKLEEKKLGFSKAADKRSLLRRVYVDLTGLPPSFTQSEAFQRDKSRDAFEKVVETLLSSPAYGECWGRHWLDVARYADTKDLVLVYGKDALRPYAYTYRDYVIRAFNEDLPFNQFVVDQLAADLVQPSLPKWRLAALGFLNVGRLFDENRHDQIDDRIDTTTRGFLGLTVACARCHDHKYDALSQRDYYGLYGVFASTEQPYDLPLLEDPAGVTNGIEFCNTLAKARNELEQHIDAEYKKLTENFRQRIGDYLWRAATSKPDITETTQFGLSLVPEDFRPALMVQTRRFLQERSVPSDRVFGLWSRLMELPEEGWKVGSAKVLAESKTNSAFNPLVIEELESFPLTNRASVGKAYGQLFRTTYEIWKQGEQTTNTPALMLSPDRADLVEIVVGTNSPIWFPRRETWEHMSRVERDRYGSLVAAMDKLSANATSPPPARAMVTVDLSQPFEPHIFKRGNPSRPGEAVPRAFIRVLSRGEPQPFKHGSGRLELAQAIVSPGNPLTARVFMNRLWMLHFGEPLVSTTTDFGARSELPANPKLLDYLAWEFIRSGWSVKHMHRLILQSASYQQSSLVPANDPRLAKDSENKLLSRFPRRRMEFEAMRDSMLLASGKLDRRMGGRAEDISGNPLNCRRTIYGLVDRQNLPGVYRAFDFPVPDQCSERRSLTTVPQQALFAMNSSFVIEQARALTALPSIGAVTDPAKKIQMLFRQVLGRDPKKFELAAGAKFLQEQERNPVASTGAAPPLSVWEQLAQVLLCCNEAIFVD